MNIREDYLNAVNELVATMRDKGVSNITINTKRIENLVCDEEIGATFSSEGKVQRFMFRRIDARNISSILDEYKLTLPITDDVLMKHLNKLVGYASDIFVKTKIESLKEDNIIQYIINTLLNFEVYEGAEVVSIQCDGGQHIEIFSLNHFSKSLACYTGGVEDNKDVKIPIILCVNSNKHKGGNVFEVNCKGLQVKEVHNDEFGLSPYFWRGGYVIQEGIHRLVESYREI